MNTRIAFGYLFLLLSVALCAYQVVDFPFYNRPDGGYLFLLMGLTIASGMLSFLALERRGAPASGLLAVAAFAVTFLSLAGAAVCAATGQTQMTPVRYGLVMTYALLFFFVGVIFSIRSKQPAAPEVPRDG